MTRRAFFPKESGRKHDRAFFPKESGRKHDRAFFPKESGRKHTTDGHLPSGAN
jgi:hypothetical protein